MAYHSRTAPSNQETTSNDLRLNLIVEHAAVPSRYSVHQGIMSNLPTKNTLFATLPGPALTCKHCQNPFGDTEHRMVKLDCGHYFGRVCIVSWVEKDNARASSCPIPTCGEQLCQADPNPV